MKKIWSTAWPSLIIAIFLSALIYSAAPAEAQQGAIRNITCVVTVSTATTIQAVGGDCAAPGADRSIYITDVSFGSSAASSTAADAFPTLKEGTGGTCGTSTSVIWEAMSEANTTVVDNRTRPIQVPVNSEVCWIHSVAGSKVVVITGYIGGA